MHISMRRKELMKKYVEQIVYTQISPKTIFCVLILNNGWEIYGVSSCRNLEKFNERLGKAYAVAHAASRLEHYVDNVSNFR